MKIASVAESLPFTATDFRVLAQRALHPAPVDATINPETGISVGPSDFDLNPDLTTDPRLVNPARLAAVLVPVVARPELTVLLTQRTEHLPAHAGQIAFPGGKVDESDESPAAAALREAEEEIGLGARYVEPLGFLDCYRTGTGFRILPLVALVEPAADLKPNPHEVSDVFEVPLAFLMDAANHRRHSLVWDGRERFFYAMPYGEHYIWGATAGIIKNMHTRLFGA